MFRRWPVSLAALSLACVETMTGLPDDPTRNPLVPDVPMYPFPSDFYLEDDPTTATGRSVWFPQDALPEGISEATWDHVDGFSRIPAIIVWLPGGFAEDSFPGADDPAATIADDSPVLLVREGTFEPVPFLAELDHQTTNTTRQALILRPLVALDPDTAYVVLLRDGLTRGDGSAHTPTPAFVALRDGIRTDSDTVEGMRDDFEVVVEAIADLALDPEEVVLGWSFHTRSREQLEAPIVGLHDAMATVSIPDWTLSSSTIVGNRRQVRGTFPLPEYLGEAGGFTLDEHGVPQAIGTTDVPFFLSIPDTIDGPRPVVAFGHGFFSTKEEPSWSSLDDGLHQWEMSAIAIDFEGFDEPSVAATTTAVASDLAALEHIVAMQLQTQARFTAVARLVREHLAQDLTEDRGAGAFHPLADEPVRYMGISNGGTQGFGILVGSPNLRRGVLVVPGSGWSHMLQRAVQWNTLGFILENRFDDPLDLQLVLSMMQLTFDPVDFMSYADRLLADPFPGRAPVEVTLHEAVGDTQVANLVTHWAARSAGIPLVTPSPLDVWGVDTITPGATGLDVPAALYIYDEQYAPLPEGNVPPPSENGAHASVRDLDVYKAHVGAFLEDGTVTHVCAGACDPD